MRVVIAGGHGKIALRTERLLAGRGDRAVGLIRKPEHAADLRDSSAEPVVLDLEQAKVGDVAEVLSGADAAVFAAGAGPGSGVARKETVDRDAAVLLADAAERAGVRRYLQISSMGQSRADDPSTGEVFAAYLRAKKDAEDDLRARDLDWTILRPGRLTDEPGTGEVHLIDSVEYGEVPRDDVAAVLVALLEEERSYRRVLELVGGHTPIEEAISRL
jgi:uncharacterized protein YbjT (DUF2867 family)